MTARINANMRPLMTDVAKGAFKDLFKIQAFQEAQVKHLIRLRQHNVDLLKKRLESVAGEIEDVKRQFEAVAGEKRRLAAEVERLRHRQALTSPFDVTDKEKKMPKATSSASSSFSFFPF